MGAIVTVLGVDREAILLVLELLEEFNAAPPTDARLGQILGAGLVGPGLLLFFAAARPAMAQEILRDSETELLFKDISDPLIDAAGLDR